MQINLQQIIYRVPWKRILLLLTLTICLSLTLSSPWIICGYSPRKLGDIKENVAPTTPTLLQGKSTLKWLTFPKVIRPRNGFFCFRTAFLLTHSTWFLLLPDHDHRDISNAIPCLLLSCTSQRTVEVLADNEGEGWPLWFNPCHSFMRYDWDCDRDPLTSDFPLLSYKPLNAHKGQWVHFGVSGLSSPKMWNSFIKADSSAIH